MTNACVRFTAARVAAIAGVLLATTLTAGRVRAQCASADPIELVSEAYAGHWDAYDGLACLEESLIARGDRRAIFTSVYTLTTLRMAEAIDAGFFADTAWMQQYQTRFANYYRQAFHDYAVGDLAAVPAAWRTAFDAAAAGDTLMVQDVLLGMNAHINRDLCYALEDVDINPRWPRYLDHTLVNEVLGDVASEVSYALSSVYGTHYAELDAALGDLDALMLQAGFVVARQAAWDNAVALDDSRWWNRFIPVLWIESTAATQADLTLAAIAPELREALSYLEGTNPGSTFCDHFSCSY